VAREGSKKQPAAVRARPFDGKGRSKRKANRVGRPKAGTFTVGAQEAITNAALPLFASTNFSAVSTKDIAAAAGLNTALIYYYFGSKEELFRRAVLLAAQQATASFETLQVDGVSASSQILSWINCHETQFNIILQLLRISMGYAATPERSKAVDHAIEEFHSDTRRMLTAAFERGVRSKEFGALDVVQTVRFVATYLDGIYLRAIILPDFDPRPEIGELRAFLESRVRATEA
jgi:AcrR family transcriptional regulator